MTKSESIPWGKGVDAGKAPSGGLENQGEGKGEGPDDDIPVHYIPPEVLAPVPIFGT